MLTNRTSARQKQPVFLQRMVRKGFLEEVAPELPHRMHTLGRRTFETDLFVFMKLQETKDSHLLFQDRILLVLARLKLAI